MGVELAFHDNSDRVAILIHPDARMGPLAGSKNESDKSTLKGLIDQLTGIAVPNQRLMCRGFEIGNDNMTLRKLGVSHGSKVTVHERKHVKRDQVEVVLACTAKLLQKQ